MTTKYVIWCPSEGGYWADGYQEFKGELYATKYNSIQGAQRTIERAAKEAGGAFVEIKNVFYAGE